VGSSWLIDWPLIEKPFVLEDEGQGLRGTTSLRRVLLPRRSHHPDHHQGFAVTGSPALFYSPPIIKDEFLQRIYRATFSGCCCGGSQPMATPSLPVPDRLLLPALSDDMQLLPEL